MRRDRDAEGVEREETREGCFEYFWAMAGPPNVAGPVTTFPSPSRQACELLLLSGGTVIGWACLLVVCFIRSFVIGLVCWLFRYLVRDFRKSVQSDFREIWSLLSINVWEVKVKVQGQNGGTENLRIVIARPWFKICTAVWQVDKHWPTRDNIINPTEVILSWNMTYDRI